MNLNELGKQIGITTATKGFPRVTYFNDTALVATKLMLIVTEVSEAMEVARLPYKDFEPIKEAFTEELADVLIRVLELADSLRLDLDYAVKAKMEKNANRPYRHGGKLV